MSSKANKTGSELEESILVILKQFDPNVVSQYSIKDIYGNSKVDFKLVYNDKVFYIEAKNQSVPGSVDQKFPYYIENIRSGVYGKDVHFIFIINTKGVRNGALSYLKQKQSEFAFSVIDKDCLFESLSVLLKEDTQQTINLPCIPVIKWAGGKRMVMKNISPLFPDKITGDFFEPFAGGVSVSCHLYNTNRVSGKFYLNDTLQQLVAVYSVLKQDPGSLIQELSSDAYIVNRENFDKIKMKYNTKAYSSDAELASIFLFLNKAGFNGVYRENSSGEYNVPFCKKDNVCVYTNESLQAMSEFLQNSILSSGDYKEVVDKAKPGDVVYFDPPYHKTFIGYSSIKFEEKHHIELRDTCIRLKSMGAKVFVSNSDTPFIRELYSQFTIHEIPVRRVVNSKSKDRKNIVYELFIVV
jgi:DNA adenine methylase